MRLDEAARAYIGVPWLKEGRTRAGLDCVGLVIISCSDCGHAADVSRILTYRTPGGILRLMDEVGRLAIRIRVGFEPGDMAVWGYKNELHVGILAGTMQNTSRIHSKFKFGVVEEPCRFDAIKIRGVYRPKWAPGA